MQYLKKLFRKTMWKPALLTALIAGVLYAISVGIYIYHANYEQTWILYVGSFAFMIVMYYHVMRDSRLRGHNESTVTLVFNSHVATIAGVLIACVLSYLILAVAVPGYIRSLQADRTLEGEPVNTIHDSTDGLSFNVFMAATVINFSVGSLNGKIIPQYRKAEPDGGATGTGKKKKTSGGFNNLKLMYETKRNGIDYWRGRGQRGFFFTRYEGEG
ncbi:MAG: hypothetical protein EOO05_15770 [Chitinophagaceae bacterium]|nr:MAG: hypothetical protein EOO05_15770 [Chitinophagaceae bacterium]